MDLIYMDETKKDIGVLQNFTLDLAYGYDENNFEISMDINDHICRENYFVYIEGTEYGGIIDKILVSTETDTLTYKGTTWHGMLENHILQPSPGEDYLVVNGEANVVLSSLITRMGLNSIFKASTEASGINISNYSMDRYIAGYSGIKKMLSKVNAKLLVTFSEGYVILSAANVVDYSNNDEFDSSQIDFDVEKNYKPVNHVICLGKGDLAEREVIHLYTDSSGSYSETQVLFGIDEVCATYENSNCESSEELRNGGMQMLKDAWNTDSLQVSFDSSRDYDVGDIVGARENTTGIFVARPIIKKIIKISNDEVIVTHKVGE